MHCRTRIYSCLGTFVLRLVKRAVIHAYCLRLLPFRGARWAFRVFGLAHKQKARRPWGGKRRAFNIQHGEDYMTVSAKPQGARRIRAYVEAVQAARQVGHLDGIERRRAILAMCRHLKTMLGVDHG